MSGKRADTLNRDCQCAVTDLPELRGRIERVTGAALPIVQTHPNLFSDMPVFLEQQHFEVMQRAIRAIDAVGRLAAYQELVSKAAPDIARKQALPRGVFFGYDFHIGPQGPKLIEINTNAGGAFLNIASRDVQIACCDVAQNRQARMPSGSELAATVVDMFRREWRLARGDAPLRRIAIVDERPAEQFLYPEFQLARALFESQGIATRVADIAELELAGDQLAIAGETVDLVYNRSTDFYFESAAAQVLRAACERDWVVVTPHPRAHALYANKRNLTVLSDAGRLAALGVDSQTIEVLARVIPATREVHTGDESWWENRKEWFFKPESGFGSRGTYRGDKMTRRVFAEVTRGQYIAQALVPAGERLRTSGEGSEPLKVDIRCYTYEGEIQLMAARLYQGQTTNFRTAGGGFAPVYIVG
jgi:hypothetical protein